MSKSKLTRSIIIWAGDDLGKLQQIKTWIDDTMLSIAENKGSQIVSASTGGNSFTVNANFTQLEWFTLLTDVVDEIENGHKKTTTTVGIIL